MIYKMFQIYQDVKPQSEQPDHCWMYICIHQCILTGNRWWNGFYTELPPYVFRKFNRLTLHSADRYCPYPMNEYPSF